MTGSRFVSSWLVPLIAILPLVGCPKNPPQDSVITAHGNTDWHIDTAEEFLFGTDMGGNATTANHCPATWTRRHIHTGLTNTAHFYYDSDLVGTGADTDATNGIDQAKLFFYAGHGDPDSWDTLGNSAITSLMSLGDSPDGGLLRYYWQCSCEVFAHGPRNCAGATFHFSCPQDFDGSADSFSMRNVYERWGPALAPDLRMACGASTEAFCHETQTDRIWDNFNNNGFDVADSFIDGLRGNSQVVPLCITTGECIAFGTPLFDSTFTNQPNPSGPCYHIQYLSSFASNVSILIFDRPPEILAVIELLPLPPPNPWKDIVFIEKAGLLVSEDEIEGRGARFRVNPISGSLYIRGARKDPQELETLEEKEYLERAMEIVRSEGWFEENAVEAVGSQFQIETVGREEGLEDRRTTQKNILIRMRRTIRVGELDVPVLGQGGLITVQLNNDGTLLNASKVWRPIKAVKQEVRSKPYDDALAEALAEIDEPEAYVLAEWNWGYKELAGNVEQLEMRPYYRFTFHPVDEKVLRSIPPRMVEISALVE